MELFFRKRRSTIELSLHETTAFVYKEDFSFSLGEMSVGSVKSVTVQAA